MPLQNRVTPFGDIKPLPERGTMLGNRGILHNDRKQLVRSWQVKRWLNCVLAFKGRHRTIMKPGSYTELFFLDEATALAAGHRPCFECRRPAFRAYQNAWQVSFGSTPNAFEIDARLERDRKTIDKQKRTFTASIDALPNGCMIKYQKNAWLVLHNAIYRWAPGGYDKWDILPSVAVNVLTPWASVEVLRGGYMPALHTSVGQLEKMTRTP